MRARSIKEPELVAVYAEQLRLVGCRGMRRKSCCGRLKQHYDVALVRLYGLLHGRDLGLQLQTAEGWLKQHPDDAGCS